MAFYEPEDLKAESIGAGRSRVAVHTDSLMMVIFNFEDGPASEPDPLHSHPHEQISYVASGRVIYFLGDEQKTLEAGDMVTIAPNVPHAIQTLTSKVRLVDAFSPVREDFLS
jgi:quercetin dioxygenase-like cupin family protein